MTNVFIERESTFGAHHYEPLPIVLTRGEGVYVWDTENKRYIDMMSAYSAVSHGHCHPKLIKALHDQSRRLNVVSRAFYTDKLADFLAFACKLSGFDNAIAMNTGAEAVETALKAVRKWAYTVKNVPHDQAEVIACHGNFHGRTIAIVGFSSVAQYKAHFGPFPAGFKLIPYGDAEALEKAITPNTAAFLLEPIQGEGGIIVPPDNYLIACAEICKRHNVLMICDEIQTGLARTGKLFAYQHENIKPDGVILGKALGGGLLPVSLFLTSKEVMDVFQPGDHGSTFGGNPLAAAVAQVALEVMIEENFIERAVKLGDYFRQQLMSIQSPLIKEIRGKGLLIGMEIDSSLDGHEFCLRLAKYGVLTKETHRLVIRFAPPLIVNEQQIDDTIATIKKVFGELETNVP